MKKYLDQNGVAYLWQKINADSNVEQVTIQLSVSSGIFDFSPYSITVHYNNVTQQFPIDVNGYSHFEITKGIMYVVEFPYISGYFNIPNFAIVASQNVRYINKIYNLMTEYVRSVMLEQSNPNSWTTTGNTGIVDDIIDFYGSYVIDEEHQMYAKLNSNDHNYFDDGSTWDASYGNSFKRLPSFYYAMDRDASNSPILHISREDLGGQQWTDEAWIGTYKGSVINGKLRSVPGVMTSESMTMSQFWEAATANTISTASTPNYGLVNYFHQCQLLQLHYAKFGTSNSENTMGPGLQNAGSTYYNHKTGATRSLGDRTGQYSYEGSTTLKMNKLFGIEDLAGSTWEFRPNIRFDNSGARAVVYTGNTVSNTADGRTFTKLASASTSYIKEMVLGEYCDFIPRTTGGTSTTYYCDATWASATGQLLRVGGSSANGSAAGLSCSNSNASFSYSNVGDGARLAFFGDISNYQFVSGTELNKANGIS